MTAYKLLALDMDGTLLDSRKQVLPKTAAALERLAAAGVETTDDKTYTWR